MKLSKEEVEYIAKLGRIKITEQERDEFSDQLTDILNYFEQLKELDTEKVEPTAMVGNLKNVLRADEIKESEIVKKEFLGGAPGSYDEYIKVKAVLE